MSQQQGNQTNNPQTQAQPNIQQLNQAQRQQQLNQLAQQQQIEPNIKQNPPNNPIQSNNMQNNPMQTQGQTVNQTQAMSQMGGQQQWNFNQMQGTSGQNQPANTSQPQQFFSQAGMNRFERPQLNNPTSKQALTMMLRQRHPSSFMNAGNNPQQANMSSLPFNIQQRQQQLLRSAALRNVSPAQMQAANTNQLNANNLGNPMMSGGGMVQQRQVNKFHPF